jgi:hypothetical protein
MFGALGILVRVELLRLLRTREVHLFLLLPALLGVPLMSAFALMVSTWVGGSIQIGLPHDLPPELGVREALEAEQVIVLVFEDPAQAWAQGLVDVAVLGWLTGDGVGPPVGTPYETRLIAVGDERRARLALREGVRRANRVLVEERVLASGGAENADLFHLWWSTVPLPRPPREGGRFQAALAAYLAFLVGLVSYQIVPIAVVSDRLEGISESFGATPAPLWALLVSRLLAVTLVELLALGLLMLSALALMASWVAVPVPSGETLARALSALVLINTLYLLPGVRARSAREALNLSSIVLLGTGGLLAGGLLGLPDWVPLAGLASAPVGPRGWMATASTLGAAAAVLALAIRLTTTESLVPPGQTR